MEAFSTFRASHHSDLLVLFIPFIFVGSRVCVYFLRVLSTRLGTKLEPHQVAFSHNMWRLLVWSFFCVWQALILSKDDIPWFSRLLHMDTSDVPAGASFVGAALFSHWPHLSILEPARLLFLAQFAFYCQDLLPPEPLPRLADWIENIWHHLPSMVLLVAAYLGAYARVMLIILFMLDFGNVVLYVAKSTYYFTDKRSGNWLLMLFALAFFLTRIVCFPIAVYSIIVDRKLILQNPPFYWSGNLFAVSLLPLFAYWFHLIIRAARRRAKLD